MSITCSITPTAVYNRGYVPGDAGIPTQGYQLVYEPVFAALESEATILQTLTRLQNKTGLLTNLVNGVDTVVDSAPPHTELCAV